jgi:PTH1 family peptidyl-tRNA hydrolase
MPQTFMNLSGESVREALGFYKLGPEDLIVCHDDIDLPFGTVRVRQGGGEGGHNGLRSICSQLGAKQYFRIRIGVGRPDSRAPNDTGVSDGIRMVTDAERHASVSDWVLSNFAKDEEKRLPEVLVRAGEAALLLICRGLAFTQQQIHRLTP